MSRRSEPKVCGVKFGWAIVIAIIVGTITVLVAPSRGIASITTPGSKKGTNVVVAPNAGPMAMPPNDAA